MKKRIIYTFTLWLIGLGMMWADNYVINSVVIPQGGATELPIGFFFDSGTTYVGFQLNINLPEGITSSKEDGLPLYVKDETTCGKLSIYSTTDDGFAALPQTVNATIKGTSGLLFTITLEADASSEIGSKLTANVTKAMFTSRNQDGTLTSVDIPDFTFDIIIGEPEDGRIRFSETASMLPRYTAGENGDVQMERSIMAGLWSTIVLPFTLTKAKAETAFGSDVQLAEFSGFEVDYGDDEENVVPLGITINFSTYTMSAKKSMKGGKPFLIMTSKDITSFEADDCTLVGEVTGVTKTDEFETSGKFTGTLVKTVVPADGLFISNEKFYFSTGNTKIKAFRGWFELDAVLNKETDFEVQMFIDGLATSVNGVSIRDANGSIYDLSGRKVNKPQHKVIYVVNGKKTAIK